MVLSAKDVEVAFSKKHTEFKTRVHKPYPISDQNGQNWYPISDRNGYKTIPFGAAHTYIPPTPTPLQGLGCHIQLDTAIVLLEVWYLLLLFCHRDIWHWKITLIITTFRRHSRRKKEDCTCCVARYSSLLNSIEPSIFLANLMSRATLMGFSFFLACCLAKVKFFLQVFLLCITE